MIILTLRTDKPVAEIALFDDSTKLAEINWQAHRTLADTIHLKIKDLLDNLSLELNNLQGLVAYKGPGSFTGLRIGLTVANTLSQSLQLPIVSTSGSSWQKEGIKRLQNGLNDKITLPEYGAGAKTTKPKK